MQESTMSDWIINAWIAPLIVAIVGGVGAYLLSDKWAQRRFAKNAMKDITNVWEKYKGAWHGVHISRGADANDHVLSYHEYELNIDAAGVVTGSFKDNLEDPPCEYNVQGRMSEGGLILDSKCKTRPALVAVEVYTHPMNPSLLKGVLVSYDYKAHHPFISFIVLTRAKLEESKYMQYVQDLKEERLYFELHRTHLEGESQKPSFEVASKEVSLLER